MLDISSPEQLDDIAPPHAATIARCRERALSWLQAHDYQLVMPPLADYIETLTGGDEKLDMQTFKITDTLSGRTLGIRADQTPQIVRFDSGVRNKLPQRRYCYCGPTLCTVPVQPWCSREAMQLGAELFGAPAGAGDWEMIMVALGMVKAIGIDSVCVDVGHAGLFSAVTAELTPALKRQLAPLVSRRDTAALRGLQQSGTLDAPLAERLLRLTQNLSEQDALATAQAVLPAGAEAETAETLMTVWNQLSAAAIDCRVNLSDLGSYGYHSGIVFSVYADSRLLVRGGRYQRRGGDDGVGFSLDLRALAERDAAAAAAAAPSLPPVTVPLAPEDAAWRAAVAQLQATGRRLRFVYDSADAALPTLCRKAKEWVVKEM